MFEPVVLGVVQGVAEWLPVSSEGMIVLVKTNFFGGGSLEGIIKTALFLHLGTFFAALVYFRRDVALLIRELFGKSRNDEVRKVLIFLIVATLISGALGALLLKTISGLDGISLTTSRVVNAIVALMLFITGAAVLLGRGGGLRSEKDLGIVDGIILGLVQGFAVIPGLSRSGLTVAALLLRKFEDSLSLRLSFLMSLPIVLAGNIVLNFRDLSLTAENIAALFASFVAGLISIHVLLLVARKVNFGWFVIIFAALILVSVLV